MNQMRILTILGILFLGSISSFSQTLKEKAEGGDMVAQYQYAQKLSDSMFPSKEDLSEAVQWLTKSALQGYAPAQCNLGFHYSQGIGINQNKEQAVYWYKKAAEQDDATAQYNLGTCYANGHGVPRSAYSAYNWYKKSAEQGYVNAEEALAECYYYGNGINTNKTLAFHWFAKAADKKNAEAMFYLGECYANGYGVIRNLQTAIEWYNKAADEDDMKGEYALAQLYLTGNGVEKDSIIATELLLHSAAGGFCTPGRMWNGKKGYGKALTKLTDLTRLSNSPNHHYFLAMLGCYYHSINDYSNAEKYYKLSVEENSALGVIELGLMYFYISANAPNYEVPGYDETEEDNSYLGLESWKMENNDSVASYLKHKHWTDTDNETYWLERAISYGFGNFQFGAMGYTVYDHLLYAYVDGIGSKRNFDRAIDIAVLCISDTTVQYASYNAHNTLSYALGKPELQNKVYKTYQELYQRPLNSNDRSKECRILAAAGLGFCYYKGLGTTKNYNQAFKYLLEAANNGDCESMRLLAACYRYGRGTAANRTKENEWVEKAAKCGDDKAKKIKERRGR